MPLPFGPLLGFALGALLAHVARRELLAESRSVTSTRPFGLAVALGLFVVVPVLAWGAAFHGDWAYVYLVRWDRVPSAVDALLVLASGASVPAGLAVAAPATPSHRPSRTVVLAVVPAAIALLAAFAFRHRLVSDGTYAQFHGAFGLVPAARSTLGRGLLLAWATLGGGTAAVLLTLRRRPR